MTTKMSSSTEFHLFFEDSFALEDMTRPRRNDRPLILGAGPARLGFDETGAPSLFQTQSSSTDAEPRFESITGPEAQPRLLLLTHPGRPAHVNGLRAPRVTLLSAGDRFHFDGTTSFRVAIYHRPRLGPVPTEHIGTACPICTIPIVGGDQCLLCRCGAAFHAAADESGEGALACARMAAECPRCLQPLQMEPGYQPPCHATHDQA